MGDSTKTTVKSLPAAAGTPSKAPTAHKRRLLFRLLVAWYVAISFLCLALLGNILLVPLAQAPQHWQQGVASQLTSLFALIRAYPIPTAVVLALLAGVTGVAHGAYRRAKRAEIEAIARDVVQQEVATPAAALHEQGAATQVIAAVTLAEVVETRGGVEAARDAATKAQEASEKTYKRLEQVAQSMEAEAPAVPANVVAPAGLPRPAALVGRDAEKAAAIETLRAGNTLGVFAFEGMGGIGKSALAAEVVALLSEDRAAFPGGAAWIPCDSLEGDAGLAELWTRVARALGLAQITALPDAAARRDALAAALAQTQTPRVLLALDNVEPGLDAAAAVNTLAVAGHTALLLTARHALAAPRLTALTLKPLREDPAAELFARVLALRDPARPDDADRARIPALVAAVDGLPLAIELTAAYAAVQWLPLATVLAEVQRDGLASAPMTTAITPAERDRIPARRFDHSWDALTPAQQSLFAGLSLLEGPSFPRAAALALASAVLEPPASLVPPASTLVPPSSGRPVPVPVPLASSPASAPAPQPEPPSPRRGGVGGEVLALLVGYALVEPLAGERLRLHPLLRQYAAARLRDPRSVPPATADALGDAALAYWLAYARAHPGYEGMEALEAEAPGLMGALGWAHSHARHRELLALAKTLGTRWHTRGRRAEELSMFLAANAAAEHLGDLSEQWHFTHQLAVLQASLGQIEQARTGYERALELARELGDPAAERAERHELAVLDAKTGRLAEARTGYTRALALARELGDPAAERDELHSLAVLDAQTGRLAEARAGYEQALELARELGDPAAEALELVNLGLLLAQQMGEPELGRAMIEQSLAICERLSAVYEIGKSHQFLASIDWNEGNRAAAVAHYREALRRFEQVQSPDAGEVRRSLRALGEEV